MPPPPPPRPDIRAITDFAKVAQKLAGLRPGAARRIDEAEMAAALKRRVRGQDHVIDDLVPHVVEQWGKAQRKKPVASLLLLGPPGTGKSELAKALAEYLYGDDKNALVFDGPDLAGPEAKTHLLGTPVGYVGADQGGKLTRPVLANPRQVIVFEEVEKAYRDVFDLFLSVLQDGRLTEAGSGRAADFTQAVVVLTGNAEHEALTRLGDQLTDPVEREDAVRGQLTAAGAFRPEVLDRIDRVYVFRPLPPEMLAEIAVMRAAAAAREYELDLARMDEDVVVELVAAALRFAKPNKVRELNRLVEKALGRPLLAARDAGLTRVAVVADPAGPPRVVSADPAGDQP